EEITLLRDQEGNLTSDIIKKLSLLFNGTLLVETSADLDDIPHQQPPYLLPELPPITRDKVASVISTLPNRKAPRPDGIPNKLIKLSTTHLTTILTDLFNCCLRQGKYPSKWKESQTAIIRKSAKDNYTDPRAYKQIALLRRQVGISVGPQRKTNPHLETKIMPSLPMLCLGDSKWFTTRISTIGPPIPIIQLKPTSPKPPSLNEDEISIAYINDVTHLLAAESVQQSQKRTKEVMTRSKSWGSSGINPRTKKEVKWLGITLTPTLSPGPHLGTIKTKANNTINQLKQIIKPTFGLCQKEARVLIAAVSTTRILHGSVVWYSNKNKKSIEKQLTKELFQAIQLSTGMMRQTPSPFLKLYGVIKDLTKQHIKLTHNYLHTKLTAPIDNA
ncbi:hypothetical protein O181_095603, partial [Austropuccinia psidii MF-1]|nr:hypothetical protein [Austropuccinia psidii MF-1]